MEPCIYGNEIEETRDKVRLIHDALLGTMGPPEQPGLITRLTTLERSHRFFMRFLYSLTGITASAILGALFLWLFRVK
jgi:hypothetical protein